MEIIKTKEYILLKPCNNSLANFFQEFKNQYSQFNGSHIIIDFSEKINIEIKDLLLFLNISSTHRENGTSFVFICEGVDIDTVPDEICVVPSFTEALDILEMEAIERDLGF